MPAITKPLVTLHSLSNAPRSVLGTRYLAVLLRWSLSPAVEEERLVASKLVRMTSGTGFKIVDRFSAASTGRSRPRMKSRAC